MTTAIVLLLSLLPSLALHAAEIKVLAGGGMLNELKELGTKFERMSGHKVEFAFAATPELIKLVTSGPFDAAVVPVNVFQNNDARAKVMAGPTIDIARVGFGVGIKSGAPKPDVGTRDKFKQSLLDAQSIAFVPASAAGTHVLKVFQDLGIAEAMTAKTRPVASPAAIAASVASGDAELGLFLTNVLVAPGVDIAGPFPGDLQSELVFTAAIAAESRHADAAKAFIEYLRTPEAVAVISARGMTAK